MSRFRDPQDPLFQALNSSIAFDYRLAPYDLEQSLAHARMLARSGIITEADLGEIERGLAAVREEIETDSFVVDPGDEDIHMAIERRLTELIGPVGGKLHTARSRNDQVATDVAMLVRAHALDAQTLVRELMARWWSSPSGTSTGRCPATRTSSARSRSTCRTTCSPTSGSSGATCSASASVSPRRTTCRSAPAPWPE